MHGPWRRRARGPGCRVRVLGVAVRRCARHLHAHRHAHEHAQHTHKHMFSHARRVRCLSVFYYGSDVLGLPSFKNVCEWAARCEARPASKVGAVAVARQGAGRARPPLRAAGLSRAPLGRRRASEGGPHTRATPARATPAGGPGCDPLPGLTRSMPFGFCRPAWAPTRSRPTWRCQRRRRPGCLAASDGAVWRI